MLLPSQGLSAKVTTFTHSWFELIPINIQAMLAWSTPNSLKSLRDFLGVWSYWFLP